MTTPFGPTDDELDGVYAGVAPTEQLEEVAAFMLEIKAACSAAPSEDTATQHIAAMVDQAARVQPARPLTQQTVLPAEKNRWRRVMDKTISLALRGAAGVLAASMSMMGLAYAGVDLPGQAAERALEAVSGVELPNQGDENGSVADDVKAVVDGDTEKGCEFGQAVATAASQNSKGDRPDEDRCAAEDDENGENGEAKGSRATGTEKSAQGRATAGEKSGGAADAGADNATTGTDRASGGADNASGGADNATTGTDRASGGADNAPVEDTDDTEEDGDAASDGMGTADEKSGGAAGSGASNAGGRP